MLYSQLVAIGVVAWQQPCAQQQRVAQPKPLAQPRQPQRVAKRCQRQPVPQPQQ